jgi:hypothetical protein
LLILSPNRSLLDFDSQLNEGRNFFLSLKGNDLPWDYQPVRLAYQPPASSTFLSEQTSHQQPASSTLLSEQTSTSHQPQTNRTGCMKVSPFLLLLYAPLKYGIC